MAYAVKELFYTLQGEGAQTGRAAVFLRFTGCNLWTGLEKDRDRGQGGCSRWCDTDFVGMDGQGGGRFSTAEALASAVQEAWRPGPDGGTPLVVCTGGEPLLQLDAPLVAALHTRGFAIAVETNGTQEAPAGLDWVCVSPKAGGHLVLRAGNELKLIFPQQGLSPDDVEGLAFTHFFLQPLDGPDKLRNMQLAVEYCLAHPKWRLSLQTHKFLGIP
ncbi:7-carboxy-7-deazaguanine synthase, Cx14CxxC type [Stigmatella aurantiaca]|uniref:7-carboxy-7-deazaguanine synthase n=1 Tax=Stigmatella aurantiaca TaxID=41 RepID=A0A1H7ZBT5_STIAU|nr:7-carboxy-7-deazaguanine synthase [Stigmatella aurantiaca]SEM54967.1 7-carboxy-7-deazaguanine synthase, Cx14CxxC type [Stigmatella aurantiaca]